MSKLLLLLMITLLFFTTSCSFSQKRENLPKNDTIVEIVENIKTPAELKIVTDYKLQNLLNYVIIVSLGGIGVCALLFFIKGSFTGILGSFAGIVVLILALIIKTYMALLAITGLVLLIGLIVIFIIFLLRDKNSFKELIKSFEKAKEEIKTPEALMRLKTNVNAIQTDTTKKLVRKVKGEK